MQIDLYSGKVQSKRVCNAKTEVCHVAVLFTMQRALGVRRTYVRAHSIRLALCSNEMNWLMVRRTVKSKCHGWTTATKVDQHE